MGKDVGVRHFGHFGRGKEFEGGEQTLETRHATALLVAGHQQLFARGAPVGLLGGEERLAVLEAIEKREKEKRKKRKEKKRKNKNEAKS